MTTTLTMAFKAAHNQVSTLLLKADEAQAEKLKKKLSRIDDIVLNLEDAGKREPILKEVTMLLTDTDFPHKLDKQPDLLCFNDRVVDLRTKDVRSGRHDDYLTVSTGYDYPKQPKGLLPDIMQYFQPCPSLRTETTSSTSRLRGYPDTCTVRPSTSIPASE